MTIIPDEPTKWVRSGIRFRLLQDNGRFRVLPAVKTRAVPE